MADNTGNVGLKHAFVVLTKRRQINMGAKGNDSSLQCHIALHGNHEKIAPVQKSFDRKGANLLTFLKEAGVEFKMNVKAYQA